MNFIWGNGECYSGASAERRIIRLLPEWRRSAEAPLRRVKKSILFKVGLTRIRSDSPGVPSFDPALPGAGATPPGDGWNEDVLPVG